MVACGASSFSTASFLLVTPFTFLAAGDVDVLLLFDDGEEDCGTKADESTPEISDLDHNCLMLSGKEGESIMNTSVEGSRRPRRDADARSSFWRVGPRPSTFPMHYMRQLRSLHMILR